MSRLPEGWVEVELGEVWPRGRRSSVVPSKEQDRRFELYSVPSFETGAPERLQGSEIGSSKQEVTPGSVLLCRINPRINRVWMVGEAGRDPQVASTEWISLARVPGVAPRFAMYALQTPHVRQYLTSSVSGVGGSLMRVRMDALWRTKIPLAPVPEQHRIVAKIESVFAKLDEGVAALKRAEANLERYRASVLKAAVQGRLTERWRRESPPEETGEELLERILIERRKRWEAEQLAKFEAKGRKPPKNWRAKYKEPVAPDTSALPELPEGWCWSTVDQVGKVGSGITKGGKKRDATRRLVPYLRVANVQKGHLDLRVIKTILASDAEIRRYSLKSGDVLFNEGGDRDKLGRGWVWSGGLAECLHQNHVFRVRPFLRDYSSEFLSHYGNSAGQEWFFRRATQSVNLASINQTVLRSLPVPLPPLREQQHIVRSLADALGSAGAAGTETTRQLNRARILRPSILKCAFDGRLVRQDPTDESASTLSERMRAKQERPEPQPKVHSANQEGLPNPATADSKTGHDSP